MTRGRSGFRACVLTLCFLECAPAWAQVGAANPVPGTAQPAVEQDALGRTTPRGTVLGFLIAERKGQHELAVQYLDTRLTGGAAVALADQLFTVLDRRLAPRLPKLSELPEGSRSNALRPDEDRVGTISGPGGDVDIVVERVDRESSGFIWLFSGKTLDSVPELYEETNLTLADDILPEVFVENRIGGIALYHWLAAFVGMPLFYYALTLWSRLLGGVLGRLRRRLYRKPDLPNPEVLPKPLRLLFLAFLIRWGVSKIALTLFARQIWSSIATVITIAAVVWLLILVTLWIEHYVHRLLVRREITGVTAILRLACGTIDLMLVVAGLLVTFYCFGLSPTTFLTGLGVGGIAVALAAQKTLENVIGGVSLILDRVVHLGDIIALGNIKGTVEAISLRSTRIRTLDRTVVSVPNGQMANMTLENFSSRDKFWFHPILAPRYGTTAAQIRTALDLVRRLLEQSRHVVPDSVRVRLVRLAQASFEIEVVAYVRSRELTQFLEIQEGLLLRIAECLQSAGIQMSSPLQAALAGEITESRRNARIDRSSP